eukprot:4406587-Pleurochrysis_carterae.AAC.2
MSCCVCLFGPGGSDGFSNSPSSASGDESIPRSRRCYFGIFFPEDVGVRPAHMFFDREKPAAKILEGAAAYAGMKLDKGRLMGSPEKLNVFTLEGDVLRLDLELEVSSYTAAFVHWQWSGMCSNDNPGCCVHAGSSRRGTASVFHFDPREGQPSIRRENRCSQGAKLRTQPICRTSDLQSFGIAMSIYDPGERQWGMLLLTLAVVLVAGNGGRVCFHEWLLYNMRVKYAMQRLLKSLYVVQNRGCGSKHRYLQPHLLRRHVEMYSCTETPHCASPTSPSRKCNHKIATNL